MKILKLCCNLTQTPKIIFSGYREKSKKPILSITVKEESRLKVRNKNLNNNLKKILSQKKSHQNIRRK